jgi:hypothetical protein
MAETKPALVLVTGDPVCDHNFYQGNRATADSPAERGFRLTLTGGGALLLKDLIQRSISDVDNWRTEFGLDLNHEDLPQDYHAFCLWEPQVRNPHEKDEKKQVSVWRAVEPPLGYGHPGPMLTTAVEKDESRKVRIAALGKRKYFETQPEILVIDDAGLDFRHCDSQARWPFKNSLSADLCPAWIVLKLSGSVGDGDLWAEILSHCRDNLILIVSGDQLRRDNVRLSRGLSWEATMENLLAELDANPALRPLLQARHLIITFRSDGAFWLNNSPDGSRSALLVFDAANAEGDWADDQGKGTVFGFLSCFTAAIVHELCLSHGQPLPDFEAALCAGLGASRELLRVGHGLVRIRQKAADGSEMEIDNPNLGFPSDQIADKIHHPTDEFVSTQLPTRIPRGGTWMMLDEWQVEARQGAGPRPHHEAAIAVAVLGPEALERFPVARFGSLRTVERSEIESLRILRKLIRFYQEGGPQKKPLNIGVFGPPGAGKSFGVTQIAKAVLGEKVDILTFNLSQFSTTSDLNGALHQVRDKVLTGATPVVFWDEFDAQDYHWLQYLLAPMQDGVFQDGQISHPVGKCVFIFAGATSSTYDAFGPRDPSKIEVDEVKALCEMQQLKDVEEKWREFVLRKGPDFKSRLVAYLNVLGPNPRQVCCETGGSRRWKDDPRDLCYPIRRAFFIRSQFKLKESQRLQLDPGVIRALLEVPLYKSGARSLEFLCQHLRQNRNDTPRRSQLPGLQLLGMHVDAEAFWQICERDLLYQDFAEELATLLHESYRLRIKGRDDKKHLDMPFSELSADMQSANRFQARRIPEVLKLVKLQLVPGEPILIENLVNQKNEEDLRQLLAAPDNLELLAEAEHNGWMVERMINGWRYGWKLDEKKQRVKDDAKKFHPLLIPYSQLPDKEKEHDRYTIIGKPAPEGKPEEEQFGYIDIVKIVGFRVVPVLENAPAPAVP